MGHREQLLVAARTLLERDGYARITARDLVAESGTNLASIGYHFGSKAALLNAAIGDAFVEWAEQVAGLVMADPDATPLNRAATAWATMLDSLPGREPMLRAFLDALAQAQRDPELGAAFARHYALARERVAQLVARSLDDGTAPDDPRCLAVAAFVIGACDGLAVQWLLDPTGCPDGTQLLAGLAAGVAASFPGAVPVTSDDGSPAGSRVAH